MIGWAVGTHRSEVGHEIKDRSTVNAVSICNGVQGVEHLELQSAGLVNRADNRSAFHTGQPLQQCYALTGGR